MSLSTNRFFKAVLAHAENMLEFGRGEVEGQRCPLFAGMVDVATRQVRTALSVPPPGIRLDDFNWCGNNLMHDVPFLETLGALTQLTGDGRFAKAVDEVFDFYGGHCPHPESGLFPWGEHLQWSFPDQQTIPCGFNRGLASFLKDNYIMHDHLAFAPRWFWEGMWKSAPRAVVNFARGLDRHIVNHETFEHNRHGPVATNWHKEPETGQGKDFARHAGFYIFDCVFAYSKSGDRDLLEWARRKLRWHLGRRLPNGIVAGCVRSDDQNNEGQHDSLATSVALAAQLLEGSPEHQEFSDHAKMLFDARATQRRGSPLPIPVEPADDRIWIDGYFRKPPVTLPQANLNHLMSLMAGIPWYTDAATEVAKWLVEHVAEPPPHQPVLARRFCTLLDTALTGYVISGQPSLLAGAERIADWALRDLAREGFLMGCSNMKLFGPSNFNSEYHVDSWAKPTTPGYYYSATGTPSLIRNLLRLALVQESEPDILGIDLHRR